MNINSFPWPKNQELPLADDVLVIDSGLFKGRWRVLQVTEKGEICVIPEVHSQQLSEADYAFLRVNGIKPE